MATLIAVYANWSFARMKGIGWGWAGLIWVYSIIFYIPLDIFKFLTRYALSGKAWKNMIENKVRACSAVSMVQSVNDHECVGNGRKSNAQQNGMSKHVNYI